MEARPSRRERKRAEVLGTIGELLAKHPPLSETPKLERLAVFGSRSLKDERVDALILKHYYEPAGVCALARKFCVERHVPL